MNTQTESMAMVQKLARGELSVKARLGYVVLLLAAVGMTVLVLTLWLTEPGVPARAQVAFGVMSLIGISWIGLSTWALTTTRILAAKDRVIAGWMAVSFTSLFLLVAGMAVVLSGKTGSAGGLIVPVLMWLAALRALKKARLKYAELAARRAELERQLAE